MNKKNLVAVFAFSLLAVAGLWASPAAAAWGTIDASPRTCSSFDSQGSCTANITWNAGDLNDGAVVYVDVDGGYRNLFSYQTSCSGTQCSASWIQCGKTYNFGLYEYNSLTGYVGSLLNSVAVQGGSCPVENITPTASLSVNGQSNITVSVGDMLSYQWSSTDGSTYSWTNVDTATGYDNGVANFYNTASGAASYTVTSAMAGHTYRVTYTAHSATGQTADSAVTIAVRQAAVQNPTLVITNPNGSTNSCGSVQFSASYDPDGPDGAAGNQDVTSATNWSASDTSVATHSGNGLFVGHKNGSTGITAVYAGITATGSLVVSGCGSQGGAPLVTTLSATGLTGSGATLNGTVNPNGYDTQWRFEYGVFPTFGNATAFRSIGSGTSAQNVSETLSGLTTGILYYYRTVAQSSAGVSYGQTLTFTLQGDTHGAPTVTTLAAANISASAATVNGSVNPNGYQTTYQFEYGTTQSLGYSSGYQNLGSGTSAQNVSASLSNLQPNTVYYFRAVASNQAGTVQGQILTFTTSGGGGQGAAPIVSTMNASSITTNGATLNGSVNPNQAATTYHFDYGTTWSLGNSTPLQNAASGSTAQNVSASLSGLSANTVYYYRATANNQYGSAQGTIMTFTTTYDGGTQGNAPTAATLNASAITANSATVNGTVNPNGSATSYRFEYGATPTFGNATAFIAAGSGNSSQAFSSSLAGLSANTVYYYRIVAQNSYGTAQGQTLTFTTTNDAQQGSAPTVTTNSATGVSTTGATLNGTVSANGAATSYRFEYGTSQSLGRQTAWTSIGSGTASQSAFATTGSLQSNTTYWYRIVAQNQYGVSQGSILSFTTDTTQYGTVPSVQTTGSGNVAQDSATVNGSVNPNGYQTTYRFEYGTSQNLGWTTGFQTIGSGNSFQQVSAYLTGLQSNTTYWFRATASNQYGSVQGNLMSFTTSNNGWWNNGNAPSVQTLSTNSYNTGSYATLNGTVSANGADTYAWFEYGTGQYSLSYTTNSTFVGSGNSNNNFSQTAANIQQGTTYWYRAVARNQYGTSYGQVLSFQTGSGYSGDNGFQPTATTRPASFVYQNSALLAGDVNPNSGLTTAWFEYGPTTSLGLRTVGTSVGSGSYSSPVSSAATGLQGNATYYYRVVASNQYGTSYGQILSLQTPSPIVIQPQNPEIRYISVPSPRVIVVPQTTGIVSNGVSGASCITLIPTLNVSQPQPGSEFTYTITYRNGCNYALNSTQLNVTMPLETDFLSSSNPFFVKNGNTLTYNLGIVNPNDQIAINIRGSVHQDTKKGDTLIFSAIFNFNDQKSTFQSLVAYLTAFVGDGSGINGGASIIDAFRSFLGSWWLTFLLFLLAVILLVWVIARESRRGRRNNGVRTI